MPIYEYKCSDCGETSELLVGVGRNSDELICRSCGGSRLEALMSAPATVIESEPPARAPGGTCCGQILQTRVASPEVVVVPRESRFPGYYQWVNLLCSQIVPFPLFPPPSLPSPPMKPRYAVSGPAFRKRGLNASHRRR